jgi:hypothetical protein
MVKYTKESQKKLEDVMVCSYKMSYVCTPDEERRGEKGRG